MVYIGNLLRASEILGLLNLNRFNTKLKNTSQKVHVAIQRILWVTFLSCHAYSTFTRSIRCLPEFCQMLLEDVIEITIFLTVIYLGTQVPVLNYLIDFEKETLKIGNKKVLQKFQRQAKLLCVIYMTIMVSILISIQLETVLPLSEEGVEMRRKVYRTAHPERNYPTNLRLPFMDETESWIFEFVLGFTIYYDIVLVLTINAVTLLLPIAAIHLRAQYETLSKCLEHIGDFDFEYVGQCKTKTNGYSMLCRKDRTTLRRQRIAETVDERPHLREVVEFHNKLLHFQNELLKLWSPIMFGFILANNMMFCLSIYQILFSPVKLTPYRFIKYFGELAGGTMEYYLLCNCSELLDDCNGILRRAILNSNWYRCTPETRKQLVLILIRVQRTNYFKFYDGFIILSRAFFVGILRVAYTFVNFMRIRNS